MNKKYLFLFLTVLTIEILIALFVNDKIIRPFVGDILVVILIYSFIKIFVKKEIKLLPVYIFLFATIVEIGQLFNILELFNLAENKLAVIIFGATFDIKDILCYLFGCIILFLDKQI